MSRSVRIPSFVVLLALTGCAVEPLDDEDVAAAADPVLSIGTGGFDPDQPRDDTTIIDPTVASKLPHAVVHNHVQTAGTDPVYANQEVTLWALGTTGISEKRWNVTTRSWSNGWVQRGNHSGVDTLTGTAPASATSAPATWSPYLPMAASFDGQGRARVRGLLGFNDGAGTARIGLPSLSGSPQLGSTATYGWQRVAARTGGFLPRSSFAWRDGAGRERVNVFGTDAAKRNLVEMWFDGTTWSTTVHATSAPVGRILLGSQSAIWDPVSGQGYVFVEVQLPGGPTSQDGIMCRYWNGSAWSWVNLGDPFHGWVEGYSDVGLVALGYRENNAFKVKVVMTGRSVDAPSDGDAVFVQTITNAPTGDTGWQQWVAPTGLRMTSGVVWYDGSRSGTARLNVFGQTTDGRLANFGFDGSQWSFGDLVAAPNGEAFKTDTSYVVDSLSYDRIAVVGRTTSGRVYERFYTVDSGVQTGWTWADLSRYRLTLQPAP